MGIRTNVERGILLAALLISLSGNLILYKNNEKNKNSIPYLVAGEKAKYFDLTNTSGEGISIKQLKMNEKSLVIIFESPCSPCNDNISIWNKLADILNGQVNMYGIILDDMQNVRKFAEENKLSFKLYIPNDIERFRREFRLGTNSAQTLIFYRDLLKHAFLGDLTGNELMRIVEIIRG